MTYRLTTTKDIPAGSTIEFDPGNGDECALLVWKRDDKGVRVLACLFAPGGKVESSPEFNDMLALMRGEL